MLRKKESISLESLLKYLSDNGSEATIKWYATMMGISQEKAAYVVSTRVFEAVDMYDFESSDIIDVALCKPLWRKYISDRQVVDVLRNVFIVNQFERKDEIELLLYKLNIGEYQNIVNAIYYVLPELRTADCDEAYRMIELFQERLNAPCKPRHFMDEYEFESDDEQEESGDWEEDDESDYDDPEGYYEGSESEEWHHYYQ